MVGFNRRFAPHVRTITPLLAGMREPKSFVMTVNAGAIPREHWTQDPHVGGGRIIGEACHFVDLLRFLAGAPIVGVDAYALGPATGLVIREDKATIVLRFGDGSLGHDPLSRQREQSAGEGTARGLLRRRRAAARQLPRAAQLRLAPRREREVDAPG